MPSRRLVLYLLVLVGGAATMGVEMCASRLLAPYFGSSLPVWGLLIGFLLAYLALGYTLGGRIADRRPQSRVLYQLAAWAGFLVGLVPYLAHPILQRSLLGLASYQGGAILGSLLGLLILFALPVVLLGCLFPFAVRLSIQDTASSGEVAGRLYALSTVGSLIGTFASVFLLIPSLGTRRTMVVISLSLLLMAIVGLFQSIGRRALLYALLLIAILLLQFLPVGAIKPSQGLIYEMDSAYNYIQVLQEGEETLLKLNEGEGIQSTYHPQRVLTGYVYDYFLLTPFFRSSHHSPAVTSLCLIGLAAGTTARQYSQVFGPIPIDGVEIDPAIVQVARRFFGLDLDNLSIAVEDGRYYLAHNSSRYDVIIVDAYCPPYIPFQLTTSEFFEQARAHLSADGAIAINVARTEADYALVNAIAGTMKMVYPSVYVIDTRSNLNSVVIGTRQTSELPAIQAELAGVTEPALSDVVQRATGRIREFTASNPLVLYDDHAPVEQIVHAMVARYILGQSTPEVQP